MKLRKLALLPAAAAAIAFGTPAIANTLTFQNVTFETSAFDSDTLRLSILNSTNANGDWLGITHLAAFSLNDIGTVTGGTVSSGPGSWNPGVLGDQVTGSGLGCSDGGAGFICFSAVSPVGLLEEMTWLIDFAAGSNIDFTSPHLKVQFLTGANATDKTGSLLSQNIPPIPEPETYAMMLAGLGLLGFVARRRRQTLGNLVPA